MIMNILKTDNYISEKLEIKPMTATTLNKIGGINYSVMVWCDDFSGEVKQKCPELFSKYGDDVFDDMSFGGECFTLDEFITILQEFANDTNTQIKLKTPESGDANCRYDIIFNGKEITGGCFIITNNKENPKILHAIADTIKGSRITVQ